MSALQSSIAMVLAVERLLEMPEHKLLWYSNTLKSSKHLNSAAEIVSFFELLQRRANFAGSE